MLAKSVLVRPQGLRPKARTPTYPLSLATPLLISINMQAFLAKTVNIITVKDYLCKNCKRLPIMSKKLLRLHLTVLTIRNET